QIDVAQRMLFELIESLGALRSTSHQLVAQGLGARVVAAFERVEQTADALGITRQKALDTSDFLRQLLADRARARIAGGRECQRNRRAHLAEGARATDAQRQIEPDANV